MIAPQTQKLGILTKDRKKMSIFGDKNTQFRNLIR